MKVAIFSETYLPDLNGVATHVKILKQGLEELGHHVLIVTADANSKRNFIEKGVLHCPAIRAKRIYNYSLSSPISLPRLNVIRRFKPDIIHIHNEFGIGLSGAYIAKILHIPLVYTLHTMYDEYIYYIAKKPFVPLITDASHIYFRHFARKASAITGPSKKVEDFVKECGVKMHVNIIPNTAELDKFAPECIDFQKASDFMNKYNFNENTTVACFCGRIGKEKSIDTLLNFWKETVKPEDDCRLVIFGDGPEKANLEEYSKSLGLSDSIIFTGKVPHDDLPNLLYGCKMYITASLSEMHSISMLEAMASGLPVLYINDEANSSQIEDGENGFIFRNADEMYEKMMYIKNLSKEDYKTFSNSVRETVKKSDAKSLAKYIVEIYNGVRIDKTTKSMKLGENFEKVN